MKKKVFLSGIQPSGRPHIANYFGMMKQLLAQQEEYSVYVLIVDYHAMKSVQDPKTMGTGADHRRVPSDVPARPNPASGGCDCPKGWPEPGRGCGRARRIVPFVKPGDIVAAGQRVGLIRFGSRVDVYLPDGTEPRVLLGQKTIAGETVLAELGQCAFLEGVSQ